MALNIFSLLILVICIVYIVFILQQLFELYIRDIIEEYLNKTKEMERKAKIEEKRLNKVREEEEEKIKYLVEKYANKHFENINRQEASHSEE